MATDKPRIKATVVGSYPAPDWLLAHPTEQALVDATRVVLHIQEQAGLDLVCDGELYRFDVNHPETNGMIDYFIRPLAGVRTGIAFEEAMAYRRQQGMSYRARPPGVIEGPITGGTLDLPTACRRARALTAAPLKFTLTGPHMLAKTVLDRHYHDPGAVAAAIAEVLAAQVAHCDADVIQIDEANLPGHPEEWRMASETVNRVLDAAPCATAVHLCFGNYGGQVIQKGSWDKLLDYLNSLHADHIVMENTHRPAAELAAFRELDPAIGMGLGVIDVKRTEVESPDAVARAIERAEAVIGAGRIKYVHPDCGFWMLKRPIADAKIRALVAGRDLYEGRPRASAA